MVKLLSSVGYCIMDNYVCAYYLCCMKSKIHVHFVNKGFENTTYNAVSCVSIPGILMNIISCCGFVKDKNSDVIFSCRIKLVSYCLHKLFFLHETIQAP